MDLILKLRDISVNVSVLADICWESRFQYWSNVSILSKKLAS